MVRDTSIEVYNKIKSEGLLSKKRMELYDHIYKHGPLTSNSAFSALGWKTNMSGRFTELEDLGVIRAIGKTQDQGSGNTVTLWDVTKYLPEQAKKYTRKDWKDTALRIIENIGPLSDDRIRPELKNLHAIIKQKL